MHYNRTGLQIIFRVIILASCITSVAYSYYETDFVVTPLMFALLSTISIIELIWYLQRLQRSWARFLLSIQHKDFSRNYSHAKGFDQLKEAYELITESFESLTIEKQVDYQLLQTLSEHIQIGLICYRKNGEVVLANKAFRSILNITSVAKVEHLKKQHGSIYTHLVSDKTEVNGSVESIADKQLLIRTESFFLKNEAYRLVSLYDIKSTLDSNEIESYQRLMSVMAHEIKNSATPILSLVEIVNKKLVNNELLNQLNEKDQKNTAISLKAIESRTSGMLKFVEAYRKINAEIEPKLELISTQSLIEPIEALSITQIRFIINNNVSEQVMIDSNLISQVIINLLKNAEEATLDIDNSVIKVSFKKNACDLKIIVEDNGDGVSEINLPQIFIPFYTTKSTGSGIGLALSMRIIKAHGGTLNYFRTKNKTTQFQIILPQAIDDTSG